MTVAGKGGILPKRWGGRIKEKNLQCKEKIAERVERRPVEEKNR